jgi:hypothetical protein
VSQRTESTAGARRQPQIFKALASDFVVEDHVCDAPPRYGACTTGSEDSMTTPNRSSDRSSGETLPDLRARVSDSAFRVTSRPASDTYCFDSRLKLLPGVTVPLRSMLVSSAEHQLLISPVATADEATHAGNLPLTLIAPSLLHHRHLETALERYHPVALWGPPGLAEKKPELMPVHVFGVDAWPHGDLLEPLLVEGAPRRNEVVFFHRDSRTIYTADLLFNILEPEGFLTPLTFRLMGVHRRFAIPRMWRQWVTDRAAFARSIDAILAWDFERIVVAHGEIIEDRARERFEAALRELDLVDRRASGRAGATV